MITFGRNINARQPQTLLLPRREHMRVVTGVIGQQANHAQRFIDTLLPRFRLQVGVQTQREIEDLRDALTRVQRGRRILKIMRIRWLRK
jgi:hypothetical protein